MQDNLYIHMLTLKSDITKISMYNKNENSSIPSYNDYKPGLTDTIMKYFCPILLCQEIRVKRQCYGHV